MEYGKMSPSQIFDLYRKGKEFKDSLGEKGLFEQTKMNERFYVGDQWHGAQTGNTRPLSRYNIIKRIGEYKISVIGSAPVAVNYSAEGVEYSKHSQEEQPESMMTGSPEMAFPTADMQKERDAEIAEVMQSLSTYHSVTAERVKLNDRLLDVLLGAFISGTGILYTYWDDGVETGQFADEARTTPIRGDIAIQTLDVENVVFGEPNNDDVQKQPYIILSQRRPVEDVKREAKAYKGKAEEIQPDKADNLSVNGGDRGEEPTEAQRVTVLTMLYKLQEEGTCRIMAVRVTANAMVRPAWEVGVHRYPLAKYSWVPRRSCIYGDSEITYLIPNQISINRALSAAVWATMSTGMPIMLVDGDIVQQSITNDPGQVIKVYGGDSGIGGAVRYVGPPAFASQFQNLVNDMVQNTLTNSGATDAALGEVRPDNAAAIIAQREAAMQPMQLYQHRYYSFCEDVARIWVDFWVNKYESRRLKIEDKDGVRYVPFEAAKYRTLPITAKVDVGAAAMWSELMAVETLGNLLTAGHINFEQYLERVPKGAVPDASGLLATIRAQRAAAEQQQAMMAEQEAMQSSGGGVMEQFAQQYPELYEQYNQLPPEQQQAMLAELEGTV